MSQLLSKVTVSHPAVLVLFTSMSNVSVLLLDDALKPATPLANGAINETLRQTLDISQGSVATHEV